MIFTVIATYQCIWINGNLQGDHMKFIFPEVVILDDDYMR